MNCLNTLSWFGVRSKSEQPVKEFFSSDPACTKGCMLPEKEGEETYVY